MSSQGPLERLVGAGDLEIESGGEFGVQRFEDVRDPDRVKQLLHGLVHDRTRSATAAAGERWTSPHSWRSSRGCSNVARSPVTSSTPRSNVCSIRCDPSGSLGARVVSLVPSSTETLLALGATSWRAPGSVSSPTCRTSAGPRTPTSHAIVALAPDLVVLDREENRLEDARTHSPAAGLDLFVSDVRTVADAVQVVADLAARVGRPRLAVRRRRRRAPMSTCVGVRADLAAAVDVDQPIRRTAPRCSPTSASGLVTGDRVDDVPGGRTRRHPGARARRRCSCRASRTTSPIATSPSSRSELRARRQRPLPVVRIDGQDLFWWGIRTPAAIARLRT